MNDPEQKPARLFRYYPEDFPDPPVRVVHMDLTFDVGEDHTWVSSKLRAEVRDTPIRELILNARDLEIVKISCDTAEVTFTYNRPDSLLLLTFDRSLAPGTIFTLGTETVCRPTDNILEGLYFDATPPGSPPTQITQCQQWGFQRLVPCIDAMTSKCTYTTTIIADERYTRLISNGDVRVPVSPSGDGRVSTTYANTTTPMAPYLFFLGVGSWETFSRDLEYPDGRSCRLELLVFPGSDRGVAEYALDVLADAILWAYLYTGPGRYEKHEEKQELLRLIRARDSLKSSGSSPGELERTRESIRAIDAGLTHGYQYTGTVYREIGMQNSDFGGMENVGNTTITMNRIMPFPQMTDPAFEYMIRVKVHEFYHNLNGSEVTGKTPFELWLNEAVTAFVELAYHAYLFGESYSRLSTVLTLFAPSTGTFALDSGAASMPIEPDGFNDPNDLITGITYVKAAEFVRMIETLMGKEAFVRGLDLYHTRFRHGNASWQDWIAAMEEVSGQQFLQMARTWLKQTGYPVIRGMGEYDEGTRRYRLFLRQEFPAAGSPWTFPFRAALVGWDGTDIADRQFLLDQAETVLEFENVDEPAFLSLNREYSFYGRVEMPYDPEALRLQVLLDPDRVNRFLALYHLAEYEITGIMERKSSEPSKKYADLYYEVLSNESLTAELGGLLLTLYDTVDDPQYAHRYRELYDARRTIELAIAKRHTAGLIARYRRHARRVPLTAPMNLQAPAIKERQLKNTCLSLLATLDTLEIHQLIRQQITGGAVATDRLRALSLYLNTSASDRTGVMEAYGKEAAGNPVSWEGYLSAVGGCSASDAVSLIRLAASSPAFRIEQVNHHRALYGSFAANRKISLQTAEGRELFREVLVMLSPVNENSAVVLLRTFGAIDRMEPAYHIPLIKLLVEVKDSIAGKNVPVVEHTIGRLLSGAPLASATYEKDLGKQP